MSQCNFIGTGTQYKIHAPDIRQGKVTTISDMPIQIKIKRPHPQMQRSNSGPLNRVPPRPA
ncbi:putative uncharacterized protein [Pseudomonas sp. StFLB209]|nr:putative uncharacterized protein [Pseudomonas sp. StFLB209]